VLKHRLIVGAALIAAIAGVVWIDAVFARGWLVLAALAAASASGSVELSGLVRGRGVRACPWWTALAGLAGLGAVAWAALGGGPDAAWMLAPAVVAAASLARYALTGTGGANAGRAALWAGFAAVYTGLAPGSLLVILTAYGPWALAAVLATIKSCDIAAYFTGRALGRRKLAPRLSPGKTWEGLIGGVLASTAVGAAAIGPAAGVGVLAAAGAGAVLGLAGQAGDLLESGLKRAAGAKDSGRVPGFGGVLDLLDSPLAGAPAALALLWALAPGGQPPLEVGSRPEASAVESAIVDLQSTRRRTG